MAEKRKPTRPLKAYREKRNFKVTTEPEADELFEEQPGDEPLFVVHKHDATRLHYDLRLELDGVLPSWAIPKGPSYDPADKRLAVETEDHPLAYAGFEGRIPDDEYGGGDSLLWDRGTWDTVPPGQGAEQRKRGRMHLRLEGQKLRGEWHLVRTRKVGSKQQWLLMKAHDGTERPGSDVLSERPESVKSGRRVTRGPVRLGARLKRPRISSRELLASVRPSMRARLASGAPEGEDDAIEAPGVVGVRVLAAISGADVTFVSREGGELSGHFPDIARDLHKLSVREAVLEGEVVSPDAKGRRSARQSVGGGAEPHLAVFDVLWLDGEDLRKRPIGERRELLQSILDGAPPELELGDRLQKEPKEPRTLPVGEDAKPLAQGERRARSKRAARSSRSEARSPLAMMVDPSRVKLTHPDRVMYPEPGYTKADVFAYMGEVAPLMVRALNERPLALQQWPRGIESAGFFRQNVHPAPDFVTTVKLQHDDAMVHHVIIDKPETVLFLANHSALTLHMWSSHLPNLDRPDWVVFDLDPGEGAWEDLITLADALHKLLDTLGLKSFPKTSGKRGLHVLVPIRQGPSHEEATDFAIQVTTAMARVLPALATVERMKAKRRGRLYLDALQNGEGKTIVAPYTLRDTPNATVSTPLTWDEVTRKLDPTKFTLKTLRRRLDRRGDLFEPVLTTRQELPKLG